MTISEESKYYLAIFRPWEVLINLILSLMGAGMANYLGHTVSWQLFWVGFLIMLTILIGGSALSGCYAQMEKGYSLRITYSNNTPGTPQETGRKRLLNCILVMVLSFGITTSLIFFTLRTSIIPDEVYFFLIFSIVLMLLYSVPPVRLINRGLGETIWAIQGGFLFPLTAFLLQAGGLTKVLILITIPMTLLYLAMEIIRSLKPFSTDPRSFQRSTLIGRVGSDQTLKLTIYLILGAYIFTGIGSLFGLTWSVLWRILLTLPVGIFLVWQLQSIRDGAKPHWLILESAAIALVIFPSYFLSLLFWTG
jgi:1,4-dihydroxy-2-naphthoate octaprenyltransferase